MGKEDWGVDNTKNSQYEAFPLTNSETNWNINEYMNSGSLENSGSQFFISASFFFFRYTAMLTLKFKILCHEE